MNALVNGRHVPDDVVADISTLSWVNLLLGSIWPKANGAMTSFVHNELTPMLQNSLPLPFRRLHFARFTLGEKTPEFGPIEVVRISDNHIQVELDMRYFSDVNILLDTGSGGLSFGISQLTFVGRICVALKPLLETWPIVGSVHIFFVHQPELELKLAGMEVVTEFPGLADKLKATVDDFFRINYVLPNRKSIPLTHDESKVDMTEVSSHPPIGVLRVRVLRAKHLAGANWRLTTVEKFTSDPYCIVKMSHTTFRTSTIQDSNDPEWPASERSAYFVVYHRDQKLDVDVFSEDRGVLKRNFVGFLGCTAPVTVRTVLGSWPASPVSAAAGGSGRRQWLQLDTRKVGRDMLHVNDPVNLGIPSELELQVEWFDLPSAASGPETTGPRSPVSLVMVELHNGTGFPEEPVWEKKGLRWRCYLEQADAAVTRKGDVMHEEPDWSETNIHPRLFSVINQLILRGFPIADVADIIDSTVEAVQLYMELRQQHVNKHSRTDDYLVSCCWHETVSLFVRRPEDSVLYIELLNGSDEVVGRLDPVPIRLLAQEPGCALPKATYAMSPVASSKSSGFTAWLFPSCNAPVLAKHRFNAVRMEMSVRLRHMVAGDGPGAAAGVARGRGSDADPTMGPPPSVAQGSAAGLAVNGRSTM